jgi:phasin family protein
LRRIGRFAVPKSPKRLQTIEFFRRQKKCVPTGTSSAGDQLSQEITLTILEELSMANPRQAERDLGQAAQEATRNAQEATRKTVEETNRVARAADAGAGAARAGADLVQRNAATMQDAWKSGSQVASQLTERSLEGFARAFGMTGESAGQAAEQSSRNLECIVQSGTIFAGAMQSISREMFEFTRTRIEQNLKRVDALVNCRTPQEIVAAHTDLVRDNLEDFVQSTRRIAEISMQTADEAARRMSDLSLAPR